MNATSTAPAVKTRTFFSVALRAFISITLFVFGLVVAIGLLNIKDEKLRPEVAALLSVPTYQVADHKNGFYMLTYLNSASDVDPMTRGVALFRHAEKQFYAKPHIYQAEVSAAINTSMPLENFQWTQCIDNNENCISNLINNRTKYQTMMDQSSLMLSRYAQLMAMTEFEEHVLPNPAYMPQFSPFKQSVNMTLAKACLEIHDGHFQQGLTTLKNNNALVRLMLKKTTSIVSRMASITALENQTHIINQLMNTYPQLTQQHAPDLRELVRPLSLEEQKFAPFFTNEMRYSLFMATSLDPTYPSNNNMFGRAMIFAFGNLMHKNILANDFYENYQTLIAQANFPASQYDVTHKLIIDAHKQRMDASLFPYVNFISKKTAKILSNVSSPTLLLPYMNKSANVDSLLRLVTAQISIQEQTMNANQIAAFLKSNTPVIQWANQTQQLSLAARSGSAHEEVIKPITITIKM